MYVPGYTGATAELNASLFAIHIGLFEWLRNEGPHHTSLASNAV